MERIAIVGCSGSGKSTLARALGARLGAPVIHLDALHWMAGWVESDAADFKARVDEAVGAPRWVCDGGFTSASALRFQRADTILWLDPPRLTCLWRALRRVATGYGRVRPDMAPGCPERFDLGFLLYIWRWNRDTRPKMDAAIAAHGAHARLVRLTTDREVAAWLEGVVSPPD
jgi:adenylate kinase family enzyme